MIMRTHILFAVMLCCCFGTLQAAEIPTLSYQTQPREYFGKRLEPRDGRIIHGAGQSRSSFDAYNSVIGTTKPALFMAYSPIVGLKPGGLSGLSKELARYPNFIIPQIGFWMTVDGAPELHFEQDVAAGLHDKDIDILCDELASLNRPVFVRIGFEFNGRWNGYQPDTYKAAFIRVVKAIRAHNLNEIAVVWCYASDIRTKDTFMNYYPGDEYVDWWGIDLFDAEHLTAEDTVLFMEQAKLHKFPVMIGESTPRRIGVTGGETSWQKWYVGYFAFMRRYPNVRSFCYISDNWANSGAWRDWGDSRLGMNPTVLAHFRRELEDPIFLHAGTENDTRRALGLAIPRYLPVRP
ncbi:MAG: glycosyl hydrolase [bacterium]